MILIDVNLLVYSVDRDAPQHQQANAWLNKTLSTDIVVGLPWIVIVAFLRIVTHPKIMPRPLTTEQALDCVNDWLQQPYVGPLNPGERHWMILQRLLYNSGAAGNLTNDAHLAAMAIEHGYAVYSADNDFKRFAGLEHVNPLLANEVHESAEHY